ncbi:MAG: FG-GAP-like repeat-containing protein [Dehalococcoidia bacterium]|nr:FG-GAP-like repeat-containing protein [Dehalococcoidia bacterium]
MTHTVRLAVSLGAALVAAANGCRSEPVDRQELLTAHYLGLTDLERGRLPEAEVQFKKVVALAPRDPLGYANLGLTYLRGGRYAEAEAQLRRARRLDPASPEIGLIAAKLYSLTGRPVQARETLEELRRDAKVLYALAELEAQNADSAAVHRYEDRLREVLGLVPANLAVRLKLVDALVRRGEADSAIQYLEELRRLRPEPPKEAKPHLDASLQHLRAGRLALARVALDRFLHVMELTAPYQASLNEVKWIEGPLVGRPVLAFNPQSLIATRALIPVGRKPEVRFTDVTDEAGLSDHGTVPTALAMGDYDGDGEDNLFVSVSSRDTRRSVARLYNVHGGFVVDVTASAGLSLPAGAAYATFADFDNDGWLDLFAIGGDGRGYLLRNDGSGKFDDVTTSARVGDVGGARKALFVDLDHDGDLDLLLVGGATNRLYRNNLDGTFTEVAGSAGLQGPGTSRGWDAAFGDFDGDGRIDIFVASADGADAIYQNTGFQGFRDVTAASGLAASRGSGAVAVGDYDNDGVLDVFVLSADGANGGETTLWHNEGSGAFTRDRRSVDAFQRLRHIGGLGAEFVDYDNDGWLDLFVAGRRGAFLFRNNRTGRYEDRTALLPATLHSGGAAAAITVSDVDADGDQDLFVGDSGGVHLLRNDGGNANLAMQVQLIALRTGSGKNNNFGIGATIEVRAGEIYQTRVATGRVTHFGLGPHLKADVLRVRWTNGVPETIYFPGTDQDVLELEQLKGSCAFLYTWDGKQFRFVTDVMWRSALGMPLGIMGGGSRAAFAPAGASQEYLRIPGEALQSRHGRYVLQFTEELWETAYLDEIRLLAVDHPDTVDVFVDERFVPPRPVRLRLFQAVRRRPPLSAIDDRGEDVLPALRERDDVYVSNLTPSRYQGLVEPHDLILDLGEEAGRAGTFLFLRGWIYPTDASINVALSQQTRVRTQLPSIEVRDAQGRWTTALPNIGFPSGKDKTIVIDLAGRFPTKDHHVRIRTNMQIYWDHAFVARDAPASPVRITPLQPVSADLHFRGFSRTYRRGGRYGPHWFAYDDVSRDSPWRPIAGAVTRFGDVLPLLRSADDMYAIMAPGDEVTVEFEAASASAPPPGWKRTFLLYSDGWIKDADLNTAFGNTVEPLPFHAIREYPYAPSDSYPTDPAHQRYLREYNTRLVKRR